MGTLRGSAQSPRPGGADTGCAPPPRSHGPAAPRTAATPARSPGPNKAVPPLPPAPPRYAHRPGTSSMLEMPRSHMSTSGWFFSRLSSTIFFSDLDMAWAGHVQTQTPSQGRSRLGTAIPPASPLLPHVPAHHPDPPPRDPTPTHCAARRRWVEAVAAAVAAGRGPAAARLQPGPPLSRAPPARSRAAALPRKRRPPRVSGERSARWGRCQ